jgi:hypothetical protein
MDRDVYRHASTGHLYIMINGILVCMSDYSVYPHNRTDRFKRLGHFDEMFPNGIELDGAH